MAHNGRVSTQAARLTRQNSSHLPMMDPENSAKAAHAAGSKGSARPAAGKGGLGTKGGGPAAGTQQTHRRALSEVGNLVDMGHASQRMDKENAAPAAKGHGVPKHPNHRRGGSVSAAETKWGSKGQRTVTTTQEAAATTAEASKLARVHSASAATSTASESALTTAAEAPSAAAATCHDVHMGPQSMDHDAAHAAAPRATKPATHAPASALYGFVPPAMAAAKKEASGEEEENCAMSLTSSLTAFSEEACGGDSDMMEAEETLPDIDWEDRGNPLHVTEYVEDIYAFYRRTEKQSMVDAAYMLKQKDINDKMRAILIDWLVEVHLKFRLMPETLHLTINLIDRYLALTPVTRRNLQLVGVTAMLVASKYEEIWAPEVKDFVYISDNAYSRDQILATEKHMLNSLKFNLTVPTAYVFAARFMKAAAVAQGHSGTSAVDSSASSPSSATTKATNNLAWYLLELAMPEYSMLKYSPSHLAAAAVYASLLRQQQKGEEGVAPGSKGPSSNTSSSTTSSSVTSPVVSAKQGQQHKGPLWSKLMERHSGFSEEQLLVCVGEMLALQHKAAGMTLKAVHKKYSQQRFLEVAKMTPAVLPTRAPSSSAATSSKRTSPATSASARTSGNHTSSGASTGHTSAVLAPAGQALTAAVS